jgi:hypothetical protein
VEIRAADPRSAERHSQGGADGVVGERCEVAWQVGHALGDGKAPNVAREEPLSATLDEVTGKLGRGIAAVVFFDVDADVESEPGPLFELLECSRGGDRR